MSGGPDREYVRARRVLLDAIEALKAHLDAVVLVGAQAIYLHTGEGDLAVAPYTTDGDLALSPEHLAESPLLAQSLTQAQFSPTDQPGSWKSLDGVVIDVMVPESLGGPGSRGARLGAHGNRAARKARGLEAALVDRSMMRIDALDPKDRRSFEIWVAGSGALLVAKLHKIGERAGSQSRRDDKDALDVLRLLRYIPRGELAQSLERLTGDPLSAEVTQAAVAYLETLFGSPDAIGSQMAARATERLEDPEEISRSCAFLTRDLLAALKRASSQTR